MKLYEKYEYERYKMISCVSFGKKKDLKEFCELHDLEIVNLTKMPGYWSAEISKPINDNWQSQEYRKFMSDRYEWFRESMKRKEKIREELNAK